LGDYGLGRHSKGAIFGNFVDHLSFAARTRNWRGESVLGGDVKDAEIMRWWKWQKT
jgi:hypothetical protein